MHYVRVNVVKGRVEVANVKVDSISFKVDIIPVEVDNIQKRDNITAATKHRYIPHF